jgi:hypothetical protein
MAASASAIGTTTTTTIAAVEQVEQQQNWKLGNGDVELPDPLRHAEALQLQHPRLWEVAEVPSLA